MTNASVLPRRRILGLLGMAGIAGFTVGAGSLAKVRDSEGLNGTIGTSEFDIELAVGTGTESPQDFSNDDIAALRFGELSPGETGRAVVAVRSVAALASTTLDLRVENGADSPLLDVLHTTFTIETQDHGRVSPYDGTLGGLVETIGGGYELRRCVGAEPAEIGLEWSFPDNVPSGIEGETVALTLQVSGSSCNRPVRSDH